MSERGEKSSADADARPRASMTDWMLRAETGPLAGKLFPLAEHTVLGRALDCDISIPEGGLSRRHAEFVVQANQLMVRDLESSNGTFHNGEKVAEAKPKHGDTISFDNMRFRVIGPANDLDKTVISVGVAPPPALNRSTRNAGATGGHANVSPVAKPIQLTTRPAPAAKAGVPAWIVLVTLGTAIGLVIALFATA